MFSISLGIAVLRGRSAAMQVAPTRESTHLGRDVGADGPGPLRHVQQLAHGRLESLLGLGHRLFDLDARAEQRLDQVALGRRLFDQVLEKSEEGAARVLRSRRRARAST